MLHVDSNVCIFAECERRASRFLVVCRYFIKTVVFGKFVFENRRFVVKWWCDAFFVFSIVCFFVLILAFSYGWYSSYSSYSLYDRIIQLTTGPLKPVVRGYRQDRGVTVVTRDFTHRSVKKSVQKWNCYCCLRLKREMDGYYLYRYWIERSICYMDRSSGKLMNWVDDLIGCGWLSFVAVANLRNVFRNKNDLVVF